MKAYKQVRKSFILRIQKEENFQKEPSLPHH